ncbi:hypothetical protein EON65_13160 [archaeon]|nr:MAG: hypothetical protein EON65_13160 [archaeon]
MYDRLETVLDDGTKRTEFQCTLHLPVGTGSSTSPIHTELFTSVYCGSKSKASSKSCLAAVEYLHQVTCVLDDHLRLIRPVQEVVVLLI